MLKFNFIIGSFVIWLGYCQIAMAQAKVGQAFEQCYLYGSALLELNAEFDRRQESIEKVMKSIAQLQPRIEQVEQKLGGLINQRAYAALQHEIIDARSLVIFDQQRQNLSQPKQKAETTLGYRPIQNLSSAEAELSIQADFMRHHMHTLDEAGRICLQQRLTLFQQLQSLLVEFRKYQSEQVALFDKYWELADVIGKRCEWERRAALRAAQQSLASNPGAIFVQALIATRADKFDEANECLAKLDGLEEIRNVVLMVRAEMALRQNKKDDALQSMKAAITKVKGDARVRVHRAVLLSQMGKLREAEEEWQLVAKLGGYESEACTALAMLTALMPNPNQAQKAKALDNARMAVRLASDKDWTCHIAMALAQAMNNHADQAEASAQQATEIAMGSHRIRCHNLLEQLRSGAVPTWDF